MAIVACGIDFGTSNTAVALARNDKATILPLEQGQATIPSAVFYSSERKAVLFGRNAVAAYIGREEGRFMRSFKRVLGTSLMKEGTLIGAKRVGFEDIILPFVTHIKARAEEKADTPLTHAVVGRPVRFFEDDDAAELAAGEQLRHLFERAGFTHLRFQFEPIAAAFAHEAALPDERERLAIVVDIGGGTSDFTVIRLSRAHAAQADRAEDILANAGARIGGNDFDGRLSLDAFMPWLGMGSTYGDKDLTFPASPFFDLSEWSKIQFLYTPRTRAMVEELYKESHQPGLVARLRDLLEQENGHKLLGLVEDMKIALSDADKIKADAGFIEEGLEIPATRKQFEAAIAGERRRLKTAMQACLKTAGVNRGAIDLVILTGGGTGIPAIRRIAADLFPAAAISDQNRFSSVGLGLAHDALRQWRL